MQYQLYYWPGIQGRGPSPAPSVAPSVARPAALLTALLLLGGCQTPPHPPLTPVAHVDLQRFMGDWYVIACVPTGIEKNAYNAVESYRLETDGTIATTFTFRDGGFDGAAKRYTPRGTVLDSSSNAVWGMQFIWPIKADYRIVYLDADYRETVIAREKRDYVWIMARTPQIPDADYARLLERVVEFGYDASKLRKVPQQWPGAAH